MSLISINTPQVFTEKEAMWMAPPEDEEVQLKSRDQAEVAKEILELAED